MAHLLQGFGTALLPMNILFVILGAFLGTVVGVLPGLGPSAAIAVLIPITFGMNPTSAIILMAAIYYGAMYGGSRSSILLNTPGDAPAIAHCWDGYPMARKGLAGPALAISAIGSLIGGMVATVGFMFLAKPLANFGLRFGPAEYFLLFLFALSLVVSLSQGNMTKGFVSMSLGLFLSTVGIDQQTSVSRFTFGLPEFDGGINFVVVVIGIYAVGEVLFNYLTIDKPKPVKEQKVGRIWIDKEQWRSSRWTIARSAPLGFLIGVLPAGGATIASMVSYTVEKQLSKRPEEFGTGKIEGVAAPSAADNAASVGALIPLLTMGLPGTATTAVMLGALVMIGLRPGPLLFQTQPQLVWSLIASMFIGNAFLAILNISLVKLLVKILDTPPKVLYPIILALSFLGTYSLSYSTADLFLLIVFGIVGLLMKLLDFPIAPLILALVVGSDMEQNFRKALIGSDGNPDVFLHSGISIVLILLTILSILYPVITQRKRRKQGSDSSVNDVDNNEYNR